VIDVSGKSVLPGLIDMHGPMYVATAKGIANAFESYPALYLAGGVTSVRSPGDFDPRSARRPNTATPSCATSRPRAMVTPSGAGHALQHDQEAAERRAARRGGRTAQCRLGRCATSLLPGSRSRAVLRRRRRRVGWRFLSGSGRSFARRRAAPTAVHSPAAADALDSLPALGYIDRTLLTDLQTNLEKPHNVRLFGARSAAAFAHVLNRDDWAKAIDYLRDVRYFMPQRLMGEVLAMGERTQRSFDEGNKKSVAGINSLKAAIRERLQASRVIFLSTERPTDDASEEPSHSQPMLQAADLAGGYARQIYLDYGLRVVCEEFKGVIHNGKMIRTWLQIERVDGELRPRRR
jgi:hypothetical protein